ncbi:ER membrane protein complex subunit 2-like [Liolophura sinensis]|uniref:ER membrane protein complex subunit 2-like n=1 Tax=Liolophura sinensis TaxID=3198878 RepID=UPI003159068C
MASSSTWQEGRDYLRKMREDQVREGDMVVRIWEEILQDYSHKLGDELWVVYEQVCIASLDCRRFDLADACIEALTAKFPHSLRVRRLHGLFLEAQESYSEAQQVYASIREEDPANMFAKKREVAILRAEHKMPEAIKKLNEYLEEFVADFDAWLELCDMYTQEQDYEKAAFCVEELIMSSPNNHLYQQRYADIRYTQGGTENLEIARAYYSQSIKLNPNNMRALYGLLLSASTLASMNSKNASERQSNTKYAAWAAKQLKEKYQTQQSREQITETKSLETIEKILENLNPGSSKS